MSVQRQNAPTKIEASSVRNENHLILGKCQYLLKLAGENILQYLENTTKCQPDTRAAKYWFVLFRCDGVTEELWVMAEVRNDPLLVDDL